MFGLELKQRRNMEKQIERFLTTLNNAISNGAEKMPEITFMLYQEIRFYHLAYVITGLIIMLSSIYFALRYDKISQSLANDEKPIGSASFIAVIGLIFFITGLILTVTHVGGVLSPLAHYLR